MRVSLWHIYRGVLHAAHLPGWKKGMKTMQLASEKRTHMANVLLDNTSEQHNYIYKPKL